MTENGEQRGAAETAKTKKRENSGSIKPALIVGAVVVLLSVIVSASTYSLAGIIAGIALAGFAAFAVMALPRFQLIAVIAAGFAASAVAGPICFSQYFAPLYILLHFLMGTVSALCLKKRVPRSFTLLYTSFIPLVSMVTIFCIFLYREYGSVSASAYMKFFADAFDILIKQYTAMSDEIGYSESVLREIKAALLTVVTFFRNNLIGIAITVSYVAAFAVTAVLRRIIKTVSKKFVFPDQDWRLYLSPIMSVMLIFCITINLSSGSEAVSFVTNNLMIIFAVALLPIGVGFINALSKSIGKKGYFRGILVGTLIFMLISSQFLLIVLILLEITGIAFTFSKQSMSKTIFRGGKKKNDEK